MTNDVAKKTEIRVQEVNSAFFYCSSRGKPRAPGRGYHTSCAGPEALSNVPQHLRSSGSRVGMESSNAQIRGLFAALETFSCPFQFSRHLALGNT